jgi:hypothetical protein
MANYVDSIVRVRGILEDIGAFRSTHFPNGSEGALDFEVGLRQMVVMHPDTDLHDWSDCHARVTDWMCDEGICHMTDTVEDATLTLYIDSAWNEPIDWFKGIVALHPELSFDISWVCYEDEFVGELHGSNGIVTKHECRCVDSLTDEDKFILGMIDSLDDEDDETPAPKGWDVIDTDGGE